MTISSSPERHTFQAESFHKKLKENPEDKSAQDMLAWYDQIKIDESLLIEDPEWQKNNMEYDLRSTQWILDKVRESDSYAQHLYAAICNNDFRKNDTWPILQEINWGCSWRHAGGIICDMKQKGDYIDWYCSGIRGDGISDEQFNQLTKKQQAHYIKQKLFVVEGQVTDEIRADLLKLGWIVLDTGDLD
jgi:hypothetical protein